MEPNKDHIKDIFSSKLSDFKPEVPSAIWDNIDKQLDLAKPISLTKNKTSLKKNFITISSWIAGAAAIVLFLIYLYPSYLDNQPNKIAYTNSFFKKEFQLKSTVPNTQDSLFDVNQIYTRAVVSNTQTSKIFDLNDYPEKNISTRSLYSFIEPIEIDLLINTVTSNKDLSQVIEKRQSTKPKANQTAPKVFESEKDYLDNLLADNNMHEKKTNKSSENIQLGLLGGSGFFKSDDSKSELKTIYPGGNPEMAVTRESKLKMEHNQPINIGLTISKRLNEKLSIESGIVYIYLSSKFKTEDIANIRQNDMQHLHYLGIPLTLNYNFAEWKRFKFYSSLGGLVQKDFYGRKSSNTYIDGLLQSDFYHKEKISQRNPQFSIHGGLGASYPLYDKLRVYTNFGTAYYIGAKNEYETIYSDKKWLFNLNIGLRFEF